MRLRFLACAALVLFSLCFAQGLRAQGIQGNVKINGSAKVIVTGHSVTLTWNTSPGASSYNVYRGTTHGGPYTRQVSSVPSAAYTDINVTHNQTFYYVVTAVYANTESGYSNEAVVTIP